MHLHAKVANLAGCRLSFRPLCFDEKYRTVKIDAAVSLLTGLGKSSAWVKVVKRE
jgi:hypothetical protein